MNFKKISFIFIILLLAFIALNGVGRTAILALIYIEEVDRALDTTFGSGKSPININNQIYNVPNEYVSYANKLSGSHKNMAFISLEYIWPTFQTTRLAEIPELETAKKDGRINRLRVTNAYPDKIEKKLSINPQKSVNIKSQKIGSLNGFEKYQHFEKRYPDGKLQKGNTSYILKNKDNHITDAIYCYGTLSPAVLPPQCEYSFVNDGLLYVVGFSETHDKKIWEDLKQKNIDFIEQFRKKDE